MTERDSCTMCAAADLPARPARGMRAPSATIDSRSPRSRSSPSRAQPHPGITEGRICAAGCCFRPHTGVRQQSVPQPGGEHVGDVLSGAQHAGIDATSTSAGTIGQR